MKEGFFKAVFFSLAFLSICALSQAQSSHWRKLNFPTGTSGTGPIQILAKDTIFAQNDSKLYRSYDGGLSWSFLANCGGYFNFYDTQTGINFNSDIEITYDAGASWQTVYSRPSGSPYLWFAGFSNTADTLYFNSAQALLMTADTGQTFDTVFSSTSFVSWNFYLNGMSMGYVQDIDNVGIVLNLSTDHGLSWSKDTIWPYSSNIWLVDFKFINDSSYLMNVNDSTYHIAFTDDYGQSFQVQKDPCRSLLNTGYWGSLPYAVDYQNGAIAVSCTTATGAGYIGASFSSDSLLSFRDDTIAPHTSANFTGGFGDISVLDETYACTWGYVEAYIYDKSTLTGVEEQALFQDLQLFPNPFHEYFELKMQNGQSMPNGQLQIYDVGGRLVYERSTIPAQSSIQIQPNLEAGIYFCQLKTVLGIKTFRLIRN